MKKSEIESLFEGINVWKRGDQRAPHKPLLLLLALSSLSRGEGRLVPFASVEVRLKKLLKEFGPARSAYHPEFPFWFLKNDGLWDLRNADGLKPRKGKNNPPRSELIHAAVEGGFRPEIYAVLRKNPKLIAQIAGSLLEGHFPESYHQSILQAVGLDLQIGTSTKKARDPKFRELVLRAYEYRCAVCGADVRLDDSTVALDAAHIKWHQACGPDSVNNGFALCSLHHRLFDRGAFTVSSADRTVLVSERIHGGPAVYDWLFRYHGRPVGEPQSPKYRPDPRFLNWHDSEVFKNPARDVMIERVAEPDV